MILKEILRKLMIAFHLDFTKNLQYDRFTKEIMKKNLLINSNCIDIGCHKGEILEMILKYSPKGKHYAFEPIPYLFEKLKKDFSHKAHIYSYALSDKKGKTTFQFVTNAPAYSGLKIRKYDISNPEIEEIEVEMTTLDEIISIDVKIDFIKIDVEGGEFGVLRGAKNLLMKNKPLILFECGKGASDYYETTPLALYNFITNETGLNIYTLSSFTKKRVPLSKDEFVKYFNTNTEYYFVGSV